MAAEPSLGHITLVTGPEEFLGERAVARVRAAVRRADPEADHAEAEAADLTGAALEELSAPSLFSATRCVVVRHLENLPEESHQGLLAYAASPVDDVALVLVHTGGNKGAGLLNKLRKLSGVSEVKTIALKAHEVPGFVVSEARHHKAKMGEEAASFLVQALGTDLRALAAAVGQLTNDFAGAELSVERVQQYFGGRAEAKSFTVADHAVNGHTAKALEELRWILDRADEHVLITAAFARTLRQLAGFMGAPRGMRDFDLSKEIGVPTWKLRSLRDQAKSWDGDGLARAVQAVATADADIKGQASDASYALEKMILEVTAARAHRSPSG